MNTILFPALWLERVKQLLAKTFPRGGAHIPHRKEGSESKAIVAMPAPKEVIIPLSQHIGAPNKPTVSINDRVLMGQVIGETDQFVSAPVHASVSGRVQAIEERPLMDGSKALCIVIENDGLDESVPGTQTTLERSSAEAIKEAAKRAGLVGMGGAGFPTHVKLAVPRPVDTVIVNGAECEPYLTCDHRLMVEQADAMVLGLKAAMKAVGATHGVIGIEVNKPDAIEMVRSAAKGDSNLRVVPLQVRYPQGAEKQLIKAALNREVPSGALPFEVGCVVSNVHTLISLAAAVTSGTSSYQRVLTVSGRAAVDPRNVSARVGTKVQDVIDFCGGMYGEPAVIVAGGPMTGPSVQSLEGPVVKSTSGILLLTEEEIALDENRPCIRCARCVDYCPMGLTPNVLGLFSDKGRIEEAAKWNLMDCIECSVCSYVCPSRRALVTWIKQGKQDYTALQRQKKAE